MVGLEKQIARSRYAKRVIEWTILILYITHGTYVVKYLRVYILRVFEKFKYLYRFIGINEKGQVGLIQTKILQ